MNNIINNEKNKLIIIYISFIFLIVTLSCTHYSIENSDSHNSFNLEIISGICLLFLIISWTIFSIYYYIGFYNLNSIFNNKLRNNYIAIICLGVLTTIAQLITTIVLSFTRYKQRDINRKLLINNSDDEQLSENVKISYIAISSLFMIWLLMIILRIVWPIGRIFKHIHVPILILLIGSSLILIGGSADEQTSRILKGEDNNIGGWLKISIIIIICMIMFCFYIMTYGVFFIKPFGIIAIILFLIVGSLLGIVYTMFKHTDK